MEDTGRASWSRCVRELRAGKVPGVQALIGEMSNGIRTTMRCDS